MTAKIGTTKATFDSKVPVGSGIDHKIAKDAYDNLGKTYLGLVELQVVERTEPYDFDVDSKVKLRVTSIELALDEEHVDELRQQMADVYASRTGGSDSLFDTVQDLKDQGVEVSVQLADDSTHTYQDTADAVCGVCDQAAGHRNHTLATV